jgi:actin-related protein
MSFIPLDPTDTSSVHNLISQIPSYELPDKTLVQPTTQLCLAAHETYFTSSNTLMTKRTKVEPGGDCDQTSGNENGTDQRNSSSSSSSHSSSTSFPSTSSSSLSLPQMIWKTVLQVDVDIRRELLNNIIPVGGGSLIDGLSQRLINEMTLLAPAAVKIKVVNNMVPVEKQHAAWIGGSVLSICGSFQQLWISRQEYDEHGPRVYLKKSQH